MHVLIKSDKSETPVAGPQAGNLLDSLDETLKAAAHGAVFPIAPILQPDGAWDVTVIIREEEHADAVAEALAAHPDVASVERNRQRFVLRIEDERIAQIGAALEAGDATPLATQDLLTAEPYVIDFCDPNATKALHVGHLRNIALGNALSSVLQAAGADVVRETQIGDAGRSMAEAMAGYLSFAKGESPETVGEKSDHFVGRLYAQYVVETAVSTAGIKPQDAPVARDIEEHDDLAESLLKQWQGGDEAATKLWKTVRGWAVDGQDETLARLGVHFDRPLYDSDRVAEIEPLMERALAEGIVTQLPSGALVYETGAEAYPELPLTRDDGFPTQNLRGLVVWDALMRDAPGVTLIHFSGVEWLAHVVHVEEMLRRLQPDRVVYPTTHIQHGMVVAEDGEMSSSKGSAILIDDLLDALLARPELQAIARPERPGATAEDLAAMTLLGLCLSRPTVKQIEYSPAKLLDGEANIGWVLAQAWSRAWDPANDGPAEPAPEDPGYRFVVMQSQVHRRLLARTIDRLDPLLLVRFLLHLSDWYLGTAPDPRIGREVRTTLGRGLTALGLVRSRPGATAD
ncbi:MAG: Arginyl-tRNA synthetase-like protein [Conexibacter sp.]|nr:Arginyl-tRNA synthetase-like protein [Conexibacter sp.]